VKATTPMSSLLLKKLVAIVGQTLLFDAYFKGSLEPVEKAVDKKKGRGTFAKWRGFMVKGEHGSADALL